MSIAVVVAAAFSIVLAASGQSSPRPTGKEALRVQSLYLSELSRQATASGDAGTGLALALHGMPSPGLGGDRDIVPEASLALYDAWLKNRELKVVPITGRPLAISPDGTRVVTATPDGTVRVWKMSGGNGHPVVLEGHGKAVAHVSFSANGKYLATASFDKTVRVWNLTTDTPSVSILDAKDGYVSSLTFSADGRRLVTTLGHTIEIWDLSEDTPTSTSYQGPVKDFHRAFLSPDGKMLAALGGDSVWLWDLTRTTIPPRELKEDRQIIMYAAFSPDSRMLATVSFDGKLHLWFFFNSSMDTVIPARLNSTVIQAHTDGARFAEFGPGGNYLVTAADLPAREVKLWYLGGLEPESIVLSGHGDRGDLDRIRRVSFSPDGQKVLIGSSDGTTRIWHVDHWSPQLWSIYQRMPPSLIFAGHIKNISQAAFTPDGNHVVTASDDGTARMWDVTPAGSKALTLPGHNPGVVNNQSSVAIFSRDSKHLMASRFSGSASGSTQIWNLTTDIPSVVELNPGPQQSVRAMALDADGTRAVTVSTTGLVQMWDLSGRTPRSSTVTGPTVGAARTVLSPDGRRLFTSQYQHPTLIWDLTVVPPRTVSFGEWDRTLGPVFFSPDGRRLLTASLITTTGPRRYTLRLWDIDSAPSRHVVLEPQYVEPSKVQFSDDGRRVLVASLNSKSVRLWDLSGPEPHLVPLDGLGDLGTAIALSPDGNRIVFSAFQEFMHVIDLSFKPPRVATLTSNRELVRRAVFSPDGKRLITTDDHGQARLWDLSGYAPRGVDLGPPASFATFSPDGKRIVLRDGNGIMVLYRHFTDAEELVSTAARDQARCLTEAQRERYFLPSLSSDVIERELVTVPPCK
jgi:WD40 repeat protein